jgi:hypothetical protein
VGDRLAPLEMDHGCEPFANLLEAISKAGGRKNSSGGQPPLGRADFITFEGAQRSLRGILMPLSARQERLRETLEAGTRHAMPVQTCLT